MGCTRALYYMVFVYDYRIYIVYYGQNVRKETEIERVIQWGLENWVIICLYIWFLLVQRQVII